MGGYIYIYFVLEGLESKYFSDRDGGWSGSVVMILVEKVKK